MVRGTPLRVLSAVAVGLALAATACQPASSGLPQQQVRYDPTEPRAAYITDLVDDGSYPRRQLVGAFELCDELARLDATGTDVGQLSGTDRARTWRRVLWPRIADRSILLPGGESDSAGILPARNTVCPDLGSRFTGVRPLDASLSVYPAPPDADVDEEAASAAAGAACRGLGDGVDASDVVAAVRNAADGLPEAHVYAWMYDHCPNQLDAARTAQRDG